MLVAADRDAEWEERLLRNCPVPGQLEIRWINPNGPDGVYRKPCELDSSIFKDVTMLYTYFPAPDGKCERGPVSILSRHQLVKSSIRPLFPVLTPLPT